MNRLYINNLTNEKGGSSGLDKIFKNTLKALGVNKKNIEVGLIFVSDKKIQALNQKFRKKDKITDVLSFKSDSIKSHKKIIALGDIYINIFEVKRAAKKNSISQKQELCLLFVHGLLHLLGYDHNKKDLRVWRKTSRKVEKSLKITLPYL